jgi:hypothetical protein
MKKITVNDTYQYNYSYTLTEKMWENFHADFKPELTPKQMLELWVFGGKYFSDMPEEFPADWWTDARLAGVRNTPNKMLNFFGVIASQSLSIWRGKLWIHEDDPRGWFQWYCRYYMGRRHEDDQRQIRRWKMMTRHIAQIRKNCLIAWDPTCRPRQKQALLQWAYDSRRM